MIDRVCITVMPESGIAAAAMAIDGLRGLCSGDSLWLNSPI